MGERLEFVAEIVAAGRGGALVELPVSAADVFGTRGRVPVNATFDGVGYQGSLMPKGDGRFVLGVLKSIQAELDKGVGDSVRVTVERDTSERTVDVPAELASALDGDAVARGSFAAMAFSHRREYARWVAEAKKAETRVRRAAEAVAMIKEGKTRSMH